MSRQAAEQSRRASLYAVPAPIDPGTLPDAAPRTLMRSLTVGLNEFLQAPAQRPKIDEDAREGGRGWTNNDILVSVVGTRGAQGIDHSVYDAVSLNYPEKGKCLTFADAFRRCARPAPRGGRWRDWKDFDLATLRACHPDFAGMQLPEWAETIIAEEQANAARDAYFADVEQAARPYTAEELGYSDEEESGPADDAQPAQWVEEGRPVVIATVAPAPLPAPVEARRPDPSGDSPPREVETRPVAPGDSPSRPTSFGPCDWCGAPSRTRDRAGAGRACARHYRVLKKAAAQDRWWDDFMAASEPITEDMILNGPPAPVATRPVARGDSPAPRPCARFPCPHEHRVTEEMIVEEYWDLAAESTVIVGRAAVRGRTK